MKVRTPIPFAALLFTFLIAVAGDIVPRASAADPASPHPGNPNLGEPPLWPVGIRLPAEFVGEKAASKSDRPADVLVWFPAGTRQIRALFLVVNNTDSKSFHEYGPLRAVAAKHEAAIVYLRAFNTGIEYAHKKPTETPPEAPENVLKLLALIAKETGIAEFAHAPWITFGKSSRGEFPFRMGWNHPERTIAGITYHGETPTWPIPPYAAKQDESILYVCANGQEEWDGTWYRHVRPSLLNYRARTPWLPHQVVAVGVGHGNYTDAHGSKGWGQPVAQGAMSVLRIWDYLALFADKALSLRLPPADSGYPTTAPTKLRAVDPDTGYAIHPRAIESLLGMDWMALRKPGDDYVTIPWPEEKHPVRDTEQGRIDPELLIRKTAQLTEDERRGTFWIADRELAEAWLRLHHPTGAEIPVP